MSGAASASFPALGTSATVAVTDAAALAAAHDLLAADLRALDDACSRFRDDSELSRLEHADGQPVTVSPLLAEALAAALRAARLTGGLVSPVMGRSLRLAGYDRDAGALVARRDPPRFVPAPDWHAVELDVARRQVAIPPGVVLDLGATAKAFAADRAALAIADALGTGVLVALGGDLRVAGPAPAGGWPVWVDDAHDRRTAGAERAAA
jgi:FAD:protein FMN transferase